MKDERTHLRITYLLGRNDRGIGSQREVDSWVWHQVGLELSEIHIQGTIKPGDRFGRTNVESFLMFDLGLK